MFSSESNRKSVYDLDQDLLPTIPRQSNPCKLNEADLLTTLHRHVCKLNRREEFRQKHREDKLPDKPTIYPSKVPLSDLETRLPIRLVRYSYQDFAEHPRILQRLHDVRTSSGRNVTLTVRIRGWPECEVNWFKDGVPLARHRPENVVVRRYGAELFELHINGSIAADAGYYSCTAHNCAGAVQTTGHVHVEVYSGPYLPVRLPCLCLRKMWF